MRDQLFVLNRDGALSLQAQLREAIVTRILDGQLQPGTRMPSCRELANRLDIARNTVTNTYQDLVDDGFLVSSERSGFFVHDAGVTASATNGEAAPPGPGRPVDWARRFRIRPSLQGNIAKPSDWHTYPYPFACGQIDPDLFPLADWRASAREALSVQAVRQWEGDSVGDDDPALIEQIRSHVLPRRGIDARTDEILVTIGAQQAIYLVASLLVSSRTTVGIEDPGYPDARNIFDLRTSKVRPLAVDGNGLVPGGTERCDLVYTTPSHQYPTMATMPRTRRETLLDVARAADTLILEDDYETEVNYTAPPTPALRSLDPDGRVVYVSSLSKSLAPGLRIGFMVAPAEFIVEARALRRLMLRHPPSNNQRTAAMFIAQGHLEKHNRRLNSVFTQRWTALCEALRRHVPSWRFAPDRGGTSVWIECPPGIDTGDLAERAQRAGVLIEPGHTFFMGRDPARRFLRLGFAGIPEERIEPGIRRLADLVDRDQLSVGAMAGPAQTG